MDKVIIYFDDNCDERTVLYSTDAVDEEIKDEEVVTFDSLTPIGSVVTSSGITLTDLEKIVSLESYISTKLPAMIIKIDYIANQIASFEQINKSVINDLLYDLEQCANAASKLKTSYGEMITLMYDEFNRFISLGLIPWTEYRAGFTSSDPIEDTVEVRAVMKPVVASINRRITEKRFRITNEGAEVTNDKVALMFISLTRQLVQTYNTTIEG